jgi:hypothetical protein
MPCVWRLVQPPWLELEPGPAFDVIVVDWQFNRHATGQLQTAKKLNFVCLVSGLCNRCYPYVATPFRHADDLAREQGWYDDWRGASFKLLVKVLGVCQELGHDPKQWPGACSLEDGRRVEDGKKGPMEKNPIVPCCFVIISDNAIAS